MQENRSSQSGVFKPRVLLAFSLCSVGVLLGMFSLAATPLSELASGAEPTARSESSPSRLEVLPGWKPSRKPGREPGAQFSPGGLSDPSSSNPNTGYPGFAGTPGAPGAASDWSIVNSPNSRPTPTDNFPSGVTCVTASDCWAVGYYLNGGAYQTLIEHWDGISWTVVTSPNISPTQNNLLRDVTCVSAAECWAVGSFYNGSFYQTLIERWDGTSWAIVSSPNTSASQYNYLIGVTCVTASDCWAVGSYSNTASVPQTLIERWDGASWTIVTSPNTSASQENSLNGVKCVSASQCWAVGFDVNGTTGFYQTLIERWDGISWTIVTSPNALASTDNYLYSVTCASASDCWAVGYYNNGIADQTLTERWNGTSWAVVTSPNTLITQGNRLLSVTCASASECWAIGSYNNGSADQTLIEHWDGTSWVIVSSPNTSASQNNYLRGVTCMSASECWAVGYYSGDSVEQTLSERWDGTSWTIVASPNTNAAQNNTLLGVTCVSASDCWTVASYYNGSVQQTLIERWDGISWSIVNSPNTSPTQSNILYDVKCVSASNCWAIGYYLASSAWQTLIERWDGTSWAIVNSPNTGAAQNNFLTSMTCVSASDCWAIGFYDTGIAYQTLIERWDGTSWTIVTSPNTDTAKENRLFGVTCSSASDCWAVGRYFNGTLLQTLIERWNGTLWTIVTSPNTSALQENYLYGVTCSSASDCWAVGSYGTGSGTGQPLIERWDGSLWTIVNSPNPTAAQYNYNFLRGVTCTSASNCWTVGYYFSDGAYRTLIERWDGTSWAIVTSPNTSASQYNFLIGVTCVSASECWAAGYYYDDSGIIQTLTEHYTASLPPPPTSVVSRKTHGTTGDFDIDLPLTGTPGIECRNFQDTNSGRHQIVITFAAPVTVNGSQNPKATLTAPKGGSVDTVDVSNSVVTVNLKDVGNGQTINITLLNVSDGTNTGNVSIPMGVLLGDTSANGLVNSTDISQTQAQSGQVVTGSNFRTDVNANGLINSTDVSTVQSKSGTGLP